AKTGMDAHMDIGRVQQVNEFQNNEREFAEIMRAGVMAGQFRADLAPEVGARAMLTYLNGIMLQWLLAPDAFSVKASAPGLVDIYIRGIAASA
ncbi:MAG TPA: TetR family transcriptional regulator C-terminal domain-containing protein, partial [Ktedonobacterales bacterium]